MAELEVIYPNFKRVQSGVSTTVFTLTPALRSMGVAVHVFGCGLPADLRSISVRELIGLLFRDKPLPVVWHARRNVEMLAGVLLKGMGANLRLVFTSAAQRHHTAYTHWLMRRMDQIVYTSVRSASFVSLAGTVVGHGVAIAPEADKAVLKRAAGLDPDVLYVASFGALRPGKGTDLFVDGLIELLPGRPRWHGLIVGHTTRADQKFRRELLGRARTAKLDSRISFTGHVPDAGLLLRAVDLCVAPSRVEGFGLTALEAMASSTPVIGSGAGSYPETIVEGVTGLLTEINDGADLTRAMARLMDDDEVRRTMGVAGRNHVATRWSIEREAASLMTVYEELVSPQFAEHGEDVSQANAKF